MTSAPLLLSSDAVTPLDFDFRFIKVIQNRPPFLRKGTFREVVADFCNGKGKQKKQDLIKSMAFLMGTEGQDETVRSALLISLCA